jgi:glucose/arabinose dehydrogenase
MQRFGLILLLLLAACDIGGGSLYRAEPFLDGLDRPLFLTQAPGDASHHYLLEQSGRVRLALNGELQAEPFLDLSDEVFDPTERGGGERGLLGLAFHPGFKENRRFFVNFTDREGHTRVVEYHAPGSDRADPASARLVLKIEQPYTNHNGGCIEFGPDGFLYVGMGDGGDKGDPDNRAQDLSTLLGKLLRIDVDGQQPYGIPPGNPFVGIKGARPEIWSYGLRNPWRFSWDPATGDLWIADVGQKSWEEINMEPAGDPGGRNYGWRLREGAHCFDPPEDCEQPGLVDPVFEYSHATGGCSITGGYLYRGDELPGLRGKYLFADWCAGKVWVFDPVTARHETVLKEMGPVTSFGRGLDGELFLCVGDGKVFRLAAKQP